MTDRPIDPADIDGLAAEHALGALPQAERAEVARRMKTDRRLAAAVAAWEHRLAPLCHREPGLPPPPGALEGILAGIADRTADTGGAKIVSLTRSRRRWRTAAIGLAAAAALALAVPLGLVTGPPGWRYAVLTPAPSDAADEAAMAGRPLFLAFSDVQRQAIQLRQVSGRAPPGERVYVLWLAAGNGRAARRIGALPRGERMASFASGDGDIGDIVVVTVESQPLPDVPGSLIVASGRLAATAP